MIRTLSPGKFLSTFLSACMAGALFFSAQSAPAAQSDENTLIDGAKLCTRYLPRHERQYGIPEHLLAAIASTESGRFHRGLGLNLPWPWTINVNGRGYFFDTKEEAVAAVSKLQSQGFKSIDVGCMQVNLRHHPKAFASVEQAFDPAYNVGYAATFLKRNFMEAGSWRKATGDYHSRTPSFGTNYANRVFGTWGRIVTKVADARAGRPVLNVAAAKTNVKRSETQLASRVVRPSYRSLRLRSISVTKKNVSSRENGVLVIRPQKNDEMIVQNFNNADSDLVSSPSSMIKASSKAESVAVAKPKMVDLADKSTSSKGQFQPKPRATATAVVDSSEPVKGNRLFVFDN